MSGWEHDLQYHLGIMDWFNFRDSLAGKDDRDIESSVGESFLQLTYTAFVVVESNCRMGLLEVCRKGWNRLRR